MLVDREGRARVTDFGIARAGASEITQTGSVLGTAQYLSPEQAQGLEVTATSDLYSIGVMLYEALTGRGPVRGRLAGRGRAEAGLRAAAAAVASSTRRSRRRSTPSSCGRWPRTPRTAFRRPTSSSRALDAAEADPSRRDGARRARVAEAPPAAVLEDEERAGYRRNGLIALAVIALLLAGVAAFALTRPRRSTSPR